MLLLSGIILGIFQQQQELEHYSRDKIQPNYKNQDGRQLGFSFKAYNGRGGGGWAFTSELLKLQNGKLNFSVAKTDLRLANQLAKNFAGQLYGL